MSMDYITAIVLKVTPRRGWSPEITVSIKKDSIEICAPELKAAGTYFAQTTATAIAAAVRRANRIHRQVFGRACR